MSNPRPIPRWRVVVRVLLFIVVCAIVLAVVVPLTAPLHGLAREFASGAIAAAGAYVLTVLFARWDGVPIGSVGARIDGSSILRMLLDSSSVSCWSVHGPFCPHSPVMSSGSEYTVRRGTTPFSRSSHTCRSPLERNWRFVAIPFELSSEPSVQQRRKESLRACLCWSTFSAEHRGPTR